MDRPSAQDRAYCTCETPLTDALAGARLAGGEPDDDIDDYCWRCRRPIALDDEVADA